MKTNHASISILQGMLLALLGATIAPAQLTITPSSAKIATQKAIVPLELVNKFTEDIEAARAVVFLSDVQGKVVGQSTRWIIGGGTDRPPLKAGSTNTFNFVVQSVRPLTSTNLTANLKVIRLVLENGKVADPVKDVTIKPAEK